MSEPLEATISLCPLMPHHLHVHGHRRIGQIQQHDRSLRHQRKRESTRKGCYHVGLSEQRSYCSKVRYANGRAADEIDVFVLKFQQGALKPDPAHNSLVVHETIAFILLRSSQLDDHVREFKEPFFCQLTFGQWMASTDHNRLLFLIELGATNAGR